MDKRSENLAPPWRFCLPSATSELASLRARLRRVLRALPLSESAMHDIVLATHEAVVNGIVHGNRLDETKHIRVNVQSADDEVVVVVEDEGPGFDWSPWLRRARGEGTPPDALQGRGVLMMTHLADAIAFNEPGNIVRLTKRHDRRA